MYAPSSRYITDFVWLAGWMAQFPAIAVVTAMARPRFRITPPVLFGAMLASLPVFTAINVIEAARPPLHYFHGPFVIVVVIVLGLVLQWMCTKLAAASAVYALQSDRVSVIDALFASWRLVSDAMWCHLTFWTASRRRLLIVHRRCS